MIENLFSTESTNNDVKTFLVSFAPSPNQTLSLHRAASILTSSEDCPSVTREFSSLIHYLDEMYLWFMGPDAVSNEIRVCSVTAINRRGVRLFLKVIATGMKAIFQSSTQNHNLLYPNLPSICFSKLFSRLKYTSSLLCCSRQGTAGKCYKDR